MKIREGWRSIKIRGGWRSIEDQGEAEKYLRSEEGGEVYRRLRMLIKI